MSTNVRRQARRSDLPAGEVLAFGGFRLVPAARSLTRDGQPVNLGARDLDLLIALAQRAGQVVSKTELFAAVWPNMSVEESNLRVHVAALRKALGDDRSGTRFIASVPGRGYSFVAAVERLPNGANGADRRRSRDPAIRGSGPVPLIRIIGRNEIIGEIASELPQKRLITITGTGGIGKTAVALAVARTLAGAFKDGVRLVDLSSFAGPALVAAQLASLLRLPVPDTEPLDAVIAHLRTRNMLIVFDSCEHVVGAAGAIAEAILQSAPEVHILATSREPLRAMGEWVQRLGPLAVPPTVAGLTAADARRYPAVELLEERATACDATWKLTDDEAAAAAEICARLDGLPLAIELAAARVPLFGLRGLANRLDDRFGILNKGRRTALARHQTLGAMIDWSYETLNEVERTVWQRLAVFRGAFTIEAADAIGNDRPTESLNVIDTLDGLVEKSLVAIELRDREPRYRLLETLRLYASGKLSDGDEAECVRRRHAEYFYGRAAQLGDDWVETASAEWLNRHGADIADIRAALDWAFGPEGDPVLGIRLAAASAPLWFKMLLLGELRQQLERAIDLAPKFAEIDDAVVLRLHIARGYAIFHSLGSVRDVVDALGTALAVAERCRDASAQLQIVWAIWTALETHGDYAGAMVWVERILAIGASAPEISVAPLYDRMAALALHLQGRQGEALRHAEQALARSALAHLPRQGGGFVYDHRTATSAHYARILWISGYPDKAASVIREIVDRGSAAEQPFGFGFFLVFAAFPVSCWSGDLGAARVFLSMLRDVRSGITFNDWQVAGKLHERVLDVLERGETCDPAAGSGLVTDASLTPLQADSLSTFGWNLLRPEPLARALGGEINWSTAEVFRARGTALLIEARPNAWTEAERLFRRAIEISRDQKALSFELRSATSLARLWRREGRTGPAQALLADVYGRFTEGFATKDLMTARALLDELQ